MSFGLVSVQRIRKLTESVITVVGPGKCLAILCKSTFIENYDCDMLCMDAIKIYTDGTWPRPWTRTGVHEHGHGLDMLGDAFGFSRMDMVRTWSKMASGLWLRADFQPTFDQGGSAGKMTRTILLVPCRSIGVSQP